jgi:hypothetical protein
MMEKDIKDYLHLYLGCECMIGDLSWKPETNLYGLAPGIDVNYGKPIRTVIDPHVLSVFSHKTTPILRKLDSMTEEEMKELYKLVFKREFTGDNISRRDQGKKEDRWVLWSGLERLFIYSDGDVGGDCDLNYVRVHTPTVLAWQLLKSFDLFNLIPEGLAIDKNKKD